MLRKGVFSIDGSTQDDDKVIGYTDDSIWNGWNNIILEKSELMNWLNASPYDYRFITTPEGVPACLVYFEDEQVIPSTPLPLENGDIAEGYDMQGYCFEEIE